MHDITPISLDCLDARVGRICARCSTYREDALMRGHSTSSGKAVPTTPAPPVVLSRWVNEPYPPLTELLSAHDVARLTRRPRWLLVGLALIGRFPKKARFRGRALGWWCSDILEWMARDLALERHHMTSSRPSSRTQPRQTCLPLEFGGPCRAVRRNSLARRRDCDD